MNIFASPDIAAAAASAASLASSVLDIQDKHNREVADAALTKMNLDLDSWYKNKINDFRNRNDYDNFQPEFESSLNDKMTEYTTGANKYANGYMQKHGTELFDALKANAAVTVSALVENGKRNKALTDYDSALDEISNGADDARTKWSRQDSIITTEYQTGLIDSAEAEKRRNRYATACAYDEQASAALQMLGQKGITEENLYKAVDGAESSFTGQTVDGAGNVTVGSRMVDNKTVHDAVRKYMSQQIRSLQDSNNTEIKNVNNQILNEIDAGRGGYTPDQLQRRIDYIERGYTPLQMDVGQKWERENELRLAIKKLDGGASGGSGSGENKFTEACKKYVDELDQASRIGKNSGTTGIKSLYGGRDVFMSDHFYSLAEQYGITRDQADKIKPLVYNYFIDKGKSIYSGDSRMTAALAELEKYAKSVEKDQNKGGIWESALSYTLDMLYDNDPSAIDYESVKKDVKNHISVWSAQELDLLAQDKKGSSKYAAQKTGGIFKPSQDELVAEGAWEMQQNKLVYTNELEQPVLAPGLEKSITRFDSEAVAILASSAGVEKKNITPEWKPDQSGHDLTGTRIYTDRSDGSRYEIIATDKKHYDVYKNGVKLSSDRKMKKDASAERSAEKKERRSQIGAQKEASDAENQKIIDAEGRMADTLRRSPVQGLSDEDWNGMARDQKILELQRLRNSDRKFVEEILKY